jgi:hypothetical protein
MSSLMFACPRRVNHSTLAEYAVVSLPVRLLMSLTESRLWGEMPRRALLTDLDDKAALRLFHYAVQCRYWRSSYSGQSDSFRKKESNKSSKSSFC